MNLELYVTLWPDLPHYLRFAQDKRLAGIRLNSAMVAQETVEKWLKYAVSTAEVPLYFDIKGRQLRIKEVLPNKEHLELIVNHPIEVNTPCPVLFKGGEDCALLKKVEGNKLIFKGGPHYGLKEGESLHVKHPSFAMQGPVFLDYERERIEIAKEAGIKKWALSYVETQQELEEFRKLVGEGEIIAKIESKRGLDFVLNDYVPMKDISLMAARGDLYIELGMPHEILAATKQIIAKDATAMVGSRMLLTLIDERHKLGKERLSRGIPECSDFCELGWLYDIGYRRMLLCDDLCRNGEWLSFAVNAFKAFEQDYAQKGVDILNMKKMEEKEEW